MNNVPPLIELPCPWEVFFESTSACQVFQLYLEYRRVLSRLKLLHQILTNYMGYTANMWAYCSFRERQQITTRLDGYALELQVLLEELEKRFDSISRTHRQADFTDVKRLRKRIDCLLQVLNTMLCTLDQVMRRCYV